MSVQSREANAPEGNVTRVEMRGGASWKLALLGGLNTPRAKRVFTAAGMHEFVRDYRPGASESTARGLSRMLVTAGALRPVSSGLYLNLRAVPPAELTEAAAYLRAGAVISLHSVLGECGFLNNPSTVVTAVLPTSAAKRPQLGEVKTSRDAVFRFHGLAEKFFPNSEGDQWEMLQPGRACATFRPEAALLQWLHLAGMKRSRLTLPPLDVDMEQLDQELLNRLAAKWGLVDQLGVWLGRAQAAQFGEQQVAAQTAEAPTAEAIASSDAARARLMSRRKSS